jgi:hypothetical protein
LPGGRVLAHGGRQLPYARGAGHGVNGMAFPQMRACVRGRARYWALLLPRLSLSAQRLVMRADLLE